MLGKSGKSSKTAIAIRNMAATLLWQLLLVFSGFFVKGLTLNNYPGDINGLVSAITNLNDYLSLVSVGLGAASITALYGPLARRDWDEINSVMSASNSFYNKTGHIFTLLTVAVAVLFPIIRNYEGISPYLASGLVLAMCSVGCVEYYFYDKYMVLLTADQKMYVVTTITSIGVVVQVALKAFFIWHRYNILLVQLIPALVYCLRVIALMAYVKRHYPQLNRKAKPNFSVLKRRWAVFKHQIAGLVVNSTDTLILTFVVGDLHLVAIYSVYNLVFTQIYNMMKNVFSQSLLASFGQLLANDDNERVRKGYNGYEYAFYMIVSVVFSVAAVMILPFVAMYTRNAETPLPYVDIRLAALFVTVHIANNLRVPGLTIINSKGHYKETENRAILEAVINIVVSLSLVPFLGIYGVLLGTVASFAYRTTDIILYSNRRILERSPLRTFRRAAVGVLIVAASVALFGSSALREMENTMSWLVWLKYAAFSGLFSVSATLLINFVIERGEMKELFGRLLGTVKSKFSIRSENIE